MIAGAVTAVGAGLIGLTQRHSLEVEYRQRIADGLQLDVADVPSIVQTTIVGGIVLATVVAAIWIGLALSLQRQSSVARWITSVLCVLNVGAAALWVVTAFKYGTGDTAPLSIVAQGLSAVFALAAVALLWTKPVRRWFAPDTPREAAERLRASGMTEREARAARIARQQNQRAAARELRRGKAGKS
jgi:CBS domain containing-hemolysin-like protein